MARALFGPGVEFERPHSRVKPEVVEAYIRRWIISNDAVPDEVLAPEFAAESRRMAMKRLWEVFERPGTDWLGALSEFYLRQRMHRFGGITITDGCHSRLTLNPLSDSQVLALANAVPPKLRAGSRYAVRVLDKLDPELARIPLGSGLRPMVLDRPITLTRRLGENTVRGFLRKAAGKVVRTLSSQRRAAAGAPLLAALVVEHWRAEPQLLAPAMNTGLISESYLDSVLQGGVEPDTTTVDFLLNLSVIAATTSTSA
jgi:asparagine synthase (glutamine-hydrolysing)